MNLQKNIAATMNQVTNEINASTQAISETQRKLNLLKASINSVVNLSPDDITFEHNVRNKVDEESPEFEKLCESIKKYGLLENVVAELKISESGDSYRLVCIAGHRRLTAIRKIGFKNKIPCLIKQFENADGIGAALSENLNREGLHCIDVANGYHYLITHNWNIDQIARYFEKDKKTVARFLKLAELPNDIKETLRQHSNVFTARVIFNDLLAKHKRPNEIKKAIERKLSKKHSENKTTKQNLNNRLSEFFNQNKISNSEKDLVLSAFKFVGLLK